MENSKIKIFRRIINDDLKEDEIEVLFRIFSDKKSMGDHPAYFRENRENIYSILYGLHKNKVSKEEVSWFLRSMEIVKKEVEAAFSSKKEFKEKIKIENDFRMTLNKCKKQIREIDIYFATWLAKEDVDYFYLKSRDIWNENYESMIFDLVGKMKKYLEAGNSFEIDKTIEEFREKNIQIEDFDLNADSIAGIDNFLETKSDGQLEIYLEDSGKILHSMYYSRLNSVSLSDRKKELVKVLSEFHKKYAIPWEEIIISFEEYLDEDFEDIDLDFDF